MTFAHCISEVLDTLCECVRFLFTLIVIVVTKLSNWLTIDGSTYPNGQSEIGAYTVPAGFDAYTTRQRLFVNSNKSVDFALFRRSGILDTAAPYSPVRVVEEYTGVLGSVSIDQNFPIGASRS